MLSRFACISLCTIFLSVTLTSAQVDPTFIPKITEFGTVYTAAVQPDGKLLLCGDIHSADGTNIRGLVRLNTDGSYDQTFKPQLPARIMMYSVAIDNNGKIIIGGTVTEGLSSTGILQRLHDDGTIDNSFNPPGNLYYILRILPLSDGNYLISHSGTKFLSRLKSDGSLDTTFDPGSGPNSVALYNNDIVELPNGKILVAGTFDTFNNVAVRGLVRLNPNGSIDNSFSIGTGPLNTDLSGNSTYSYISDLALDGEKIIAVGSFSSFNSVAAKNIVRLNSDGSVDASFPLPGPAGNFFDRNIETVAVQSGGLILGGHSFTDQYRYKFMKLKLDGTIEASFPQVTTDLSGNVNGVSSPRIAVSEEKTYVIAPFEHYGSVRARGIVSLTSAGNVDDTFHASVGGNATVHTIKRLADGDFLVGGAFNYVGSTYCNNFARLNPDGSVDETFAANIGAGFSRSVSCIELQPDGKILVAGAFEKFNLNYKSLLVRLNADGSLDNSFNASSISQKYVGVGINSLHLLPSGKVLVGGGFYFYNGMSQHNNLVRLNANGSLDLSFNVNLLPEDHHINTVAIKPDGNILIAGAKYPLNGGFIKQVTADGSVTNDFSGVNLTTLIPQRIRLYDDSKFLVSTMANNFSTTAPNSILQFSNTGALVDQLSLATFEGHVTAIEPAANGYFLIGGTFEKVNGVPRRGLAKVKLDGSIESAFDYSVEGRIHNLVRDNSAANKLYLMGTLTSVAQTTAFGVVQLDLDKQIPPSSLTYTLDDQEGIVTLAWRDNSSGEDGFVIFRTEGNSTLAIDSVADQVTTFKDVTALPSKQYVYKVAAFAGTTQSTPTNEVSVSTSAWLPPSVPAQFAFTVASNFSTTNLTWQDVSTENGYELEQSVNAGDFVKLSELQKDAVTFTDEFLFETSVRYRIRAFNKFGKSGYSTILELPLITGLEESSAHEVSAYPNPTTGSLSLLKKTTGPFRALIYTMDGKVLKEVAGSGEYTELNLDNFPKGIYFIKVVDGDHVTTLRVTRL